MLYYMKWVSALLILTTSNLMAKSLNGTELTANMQCKKLGSSSAQPLAAWRSTVAVLWQSANSKCQEWFTVTWRSVILAFNLCEAVEQLSWYISHLAADAILGSLGMDNMTAVYYGVTQYHILYFWLRATHTGMKLWLCCRHTGWPSVVSSPFAVETLTVTANVKGGATQ